MKPLWINMDIDNIRQICTSLPAVTEDIKWEHDLVFSVGNKMFCVLGIDEIPISAAFKVSHDDFEEMCERDGFMPAPYVARYKWVKIDNVDRLSKLEWEYYIVHSYKLVKSKLTTKILRQLNIDY